MDYGLDKKSTSLKTFNTVFIIFWLLNSTPFGLSIKMAGENPMALEAQGIDVLNLVKSLQEVQQQDNMAQQQAMQMEEMKQGAAALKAPLLDPSKNPELQAALTEEGQAPTPPML